MRSSLAPLLAGTLLASAAAAQGPAVDPIPFEWITGARETGFPFGLPTRRVVRYQEVHDGMRGRPRNVTAVAFRRSPLDSHRVPPFTADVELRLSTARTTAATITPTFADNPGLDVVTVLPRRTVSFAASPGVTTTPAAFEYALPADVPFAFAGAGPLCLDLRVFGHTNPIAARFDLFAEGYAHLGEVGPGCGNASLVTRLAYPDVLHEVRGVTPGAPVFLMTGGSFEYTGGTPLPLELTPIGAPGCAVRVDPLVISGGVADPSGVFRVTVPGASAMPGSFYGAQAVASQPGANPIGVVTTNATVVVPVTGRSIGRVWAEDLQALSGTRQPVFGLILEVR